MPLFRNILALFLLPALASMFFVYDTHQISSRIAAAVIQNSVPFSPTEPVDTPPPPTTSTTTPPAEPLERELVLTQHEPIVTVVTLSDVAVKEVEITSPPTLPKERFLGETLITLIHEGTNVARAREDLPPLALDVALSAFASERSDDMTARHYLSHTTPDGCTISCHFKASGYNSMNWGENLAEFEPYQVVSEQKIASTFITKWLESSGHRRNLLSDEFTSQGIGVSVSGDRLVITVIFASPE